LNESVQLTVDQIKSEIAAAFPAGVAITDKCKPQTIFMTADKDCLLKLCTFLKEKQGFDHCSCVCGVDRVDRFQTVYHLSSCSRNVIVEITVDLPHDDPRVDSVTPLWGGANWHERETYDMFGIIFINHPRLERLLLPEDVQFFPMRKDYIVGGP